MGLLLMVPLSIDGEPKKMWSSNLQDRVDFEPLSSVYGPFG